MSTEATAKESAPSPDCSDADLIAAAEAVDAGRPIPAPSSPSASEQTATPPEAGENANKQESAEERAAREEAEAADAAAQTEAAKQQQQQKQPPKPGEKPQSEFEKARAEADRKDRSWKKLNEEKEALRAQEAQIQQERAELARLRTEVEELKKRPATPPAPAKDEHGLEASDYDRMAEKYANQGNDTMAKLAKEQASALRAKAAPAAPAQPANAAPDITSPEFQAKWREHTAALVQAEPDLAKPDNPVVQTANALLQDKTWSPYFLSRPDGIRAAVAVAKLQTDAARVPVLAKELEAQKAEVARLTKLVSPRGSLPASSAPADKSPGDLNDAEMLALAAQADASGG